jgi:hypothetical protein
MTSSSSTHSNIDLTTSNNLLITFNAISNFVSALSDLFGKQQRPLKLYGRLIGKTAITHHESITKHVNAFRQFCIQNREAIVAKQSTKLTLNKISFSDRLYIDMSDVFKKSEYDKDTTSVIWQHLLCISALVDPTGRAKEILKENLSKNGNDKNASESDFLSNIIDKVESTVDPNADPMQAVASIMQSGVFTDLISGMTTGLQSGSLDIGKLMGAVSGMVGKLNGQANGDPQANNMINMVTSMMGNLGGVSGDSSATSTPDIMSMMSMMGPLIGGLTATSQDSHIDGPSMSLPDNNIPD